MGNPLRRISALTRPLHRGVNRSDQDGAHYTERSEDRYVDECLKKHLQADKNQNDGKAELEVDELVNDARQQEIERAQAEHGADVGGIDDEWIARDGKDCWYG